MRKAWSCCWKSSKQPRKQHKYIYNAPCHVRNKLLSAHLSRVIRKDFGRRSFSLRKGDEVTVIKGEYKGRSGKVSKVNRQRLCVFIDGIKMRKVSGQEIDVPIRPANLVITRLYDEDKIRMKRIKRIVNQKIGSENKTDGKLR